MSPLMRKIFIAIFAFIVPFDVDVVLQLYEDPLINMLQTEPYGTPPRYGLRGRGCTSISYSAACLMLM